MSAMQPYDACGIVVRIAPAPTKQPTGTIASVTYVTTRAQWRSSQIHATPTARRKTSIGAKK